MVVEDGESRGIVGWKVSDEIVKMTEQSTKLKWYVAFVKMNLAITEAARL